MKRDLHHKTFFENLVVFAEKLYKQKILYIVIHLLLVNLKTSHVYTGCLTDNGTIDSLGKQEVKKLFGDVSRYFRIFSATTFFNEPYYNIVAFSTLPSPSYHFYKILLQIYI